MNHKNIGREYYRGIIAVDEGSEPSTVMVWEYKNLEENNDTQAEICFMSSADAEAAEFLLSEFDEQASSNDVQRSFFDLCDLSEDITKCLAADVGSGLTVMSAYGIREKDESVEAFTERLLKLSI